MSILFDTERELIIKIAQTIAQYEGYIIDEETVGLALLTLDMGGTPANSRLNRMLNTSLNIVKLVKNYDLHS